MNSSMDRMERHTADATAYLNACGFGNFSISRTWMDGSGNPGATITMHLPLTECAMIVHLFDLDAVRHCRVYSLHLAGRTAAGEQYLRLKIDLQVL